jgi:hypothetical protein
MDSLKPHPFPVECSGMVVSLLFPVLALKDIATSENGDELGMCISDVTGQLCPFRDL